MEIVQTFMEMGRRSIEQASAIALVGLPLLLLTLFKSSGEFKRVFKEALAPSTRVNVIAFVFDLVVMSLPLGVLYTITIAGLGRSDGTGFLDQLGLPAWALVGLAIFAGDGVAYFRHRLEHSRWLWPSHAMHHSDETMNCLTVLRFHPINRVTTVMIDLGVLLVLGFPMWAIAGGFVFRHYYGIFVHANVPWTLGPLGYVLVSPAMHRWHHVREGQGIGSNFSSVFSVFDRLFGTYYCPGPCNERLGVEGVKHQSFFAQLLEPFVLPFRRKPVESTQSKLN